MLLRVPILLTLLLSASAYAQVEVSDCNQELLGENGHLTADLDCGSDPNDSISICNASLDLRGFTLRVPYLSCDGPCECEVFGGTLEGSILGDHGVFIDPPRVAVHDMLVTSSNGDCIAVHGRVGVARSTISGCPAYGVLAEPAVISGSSISGADVGIAARGLKLFDTSVTGNGDGIVVDGRATLRSAVIEQNSRSGIVQRIIQKCTALVLRDTAVSQNGAYGILHQARSVKLVNSSISDNGLSGVSRASICEDRVNSKRSTIVANGASVKCAVPGTVCVDIDSTSEPKLRESSCDRSHDAGSGEPGNSWGVCALD